MKVTRKTNNLHLTEDALLPYSKTQKLLFTFLPKDGSKITSSELAAMKKRATRWNIEFPTNAIITTMGHLMSKVARNKEPFRIKKSPPRGPIQSEFWIERT
jgi:hypothetical protein